MSHLTDDRSNDAGPRGGQDFRTEMAVDELLAANVFVRIIGADKLPLVRWRHEKALQGPFKGMFPWAPADSAAGPGTNVPLKLKPKAGPNPLPPNPDDPNNPLGGYFADGSWIDHSSGSYGPGWGSISYVGQGLGIFDPRNGPISFGNPLAPEEDSTSFSGTGIGPDPFASGFFSHVIGNKEGGYPSVLKSYAPTAATTEGSITSDRPARRLGAARWQTAFMVRTVGVAAAAGAAPKPPPTVEAPGGDVIARYFFVGTEPETLIVGGTTYRILDHNPQKTYTAPGGQTVGSYTYQAISVASGQINAGPPSTGTGPATLSYAPVPVLLPYAVIIPVTAGGLTLIIKSPPTPKPGYVLGNTYVQYGGNALGQYVPIYVQFVFVPITPPSAGGGDTSGEDGTNSTQPGPKGEGPGCLVLPTVTNKYLPDTRFVPHGIPLEGRKPMWPRMPVGTYGIVMQTMDEDQQIEDLMHCDPRIVCVNAAGGEACGSMVYDLEKHSAYDGSRGARVQSAWRVLVSPQLPKFVPIGGYGKPKVNGYNAQGAGNTLALQFNTSGRGDSPGGYVYDSGHVAMWAAEYGGAMYCGAAQGGDKHQLGQDKDSNPINPMHLSCLAPFFQDKIHDGPLKFYPGTWPDQVYDDWPYQSLVKCLFNPGRSYPFPNKAGQLKGMWEWLSQVAVEVTPPVITPRDPGNRIPSDPPVPPLPPPPTTPGNPNFPWPGGRPGAPNGPEHPTGIVEMFDEPIAAVRSPPPTTIAAGNSLVLEARRNAVMVHELTSPGILFRPISYADGTVDTRHQDGVAFGGQEAVKAVERAAPVTGRLTAWAKERSQGFAYTQSPGKSRYVGGSAAGGLALTPPEVDMTDAAAYFKPSNLTISPTFLVAVPGAAFATGLPDRTTGGVVDGFSISAPDGAFDDRLVIYKHDGAAAKSEILKLTDVESGNHFLATPADGSAGPFEGRALVAADGAGIFEPAGLATKVASISQWSVLGTLAGATTYFAGPGVGLGLVENSFPVPTVGGATARRLYVKLGAAPGGTETVTITIRKNGSDTAVTVTITGAATTGSDVANTAAFAAGDLISASVVTSATAVAENVRLSFELATG